MSWYELDRIERKRQAREDMCLDAMVAIDKIEDELLLKIENTEIKLALVEWCNGFKKIFEDLDLACEVDESKYYAYYKELYNLLGKDQQAYEVICEGCRWAKKCVDRYEFAKNLLTRKSSLPSLTVFQL
jgi:hypothetical protein